MSKIGRKPIEIGKTKVEIAGQEITYKGPHASGSYQLPEALVASLEGEQLLITAAEKPRMSQRHVNRVWGLHRALLSNKVCGASTPFEKKMEIVGLGFKAAVSGKNVIFSLGFSHKIDFVLPATVTLDVDKTGQKLLFKSPDRDLLGHVCSMVRALRPPEPYKGTGIRLADEEITRKAGKTKAA
jgi:large subunit ribosomal protein L6